MEKIKPCPFCGGKGQIFNRVLNIKHVECLICGASRKIPATQEKYAIMHWNRRETDNKR